MSINSKWIAPKPVPQATELELSEFEQVERQILYMRGISTKSAAEEYLSKNRLDDHDPFILRGMDAAVDRIKTALKLGERITIYGDYDVDGVTSTVLMMEVLGRLGCQVDHYIPDRFSEGYGLNDKAISSIAERGTKLVISVDCGIRDVDVIARAAESGVDVIIVDHHEPGDELPRAVAAIDPKQSNDEYPFKSLAGVGLTYKLAQALTRTLGVGPPEDVLDLVALGTVADVARLRGENRLLASIGLEKLNETSRPGLQEIIKIARLSAGSVTASSIGFIIGPRLNAAGRLGSADRALRLLYTTDRAEAKELAAKLEAVNRRRREITVKAVERAIEITQVNLDGPSVILVADESFNEGVVGLIAARLKDRFYRPSFVATRGKEITRGSARSIPGFNIAEALNGCDEILEKYGGHERAGGFTLKTERLSEFERRLGTIAEQQLEGVDLIPELEIDAELSMAALGTGLMEFLDRLEPCGEGNPAPVLMARNVSVMRKRAVGAEGAHLKLTFRQAGRNMDAIAFRKGELVRELPETVDVAFRFERNEYMGISSLQMNVLEMRWEGMNG